MSDIKEDTAKSVKKRRSPNDQGPSLKNMSPEEADEHLSLLATGKAKLSGLEVAIEQNMRASFAQQNQLRTEQSRLEEALEKTKMSLQNVQGQISAYSHLLVTAEDDRRSK